MQRRFIGLALTGLLQLPATALPAGLPSLAEPALSPDNSEIAFVSGGDIWTVPAQGGTAHLLVTYPAAESRPLYSPDGTKLAFVSTRTGNGDIYVLTLATGQIQRVTFSDVADQLDGWSRDGKWLYFTSGVNDVAGQGDIFRVSVEGGTPLEVSRERFLNEFESAPSPDGQHLALVAKGMSRSQWWRHGHSHIDDSEIWLHSLGGEYRKLVGGAAKNAWPMWAPDGDRLYFMRDSEGENLWRTSLKSQQIEPLTHFHEGRVLWPSISYDGKTIVFERDFRIWKCDTASGQASPLSVQLRGSAASPGVRHLTESRFQDLALSPDGKKLAMVAHGQIFAAPAKEGGEAQRITWSENVESDPRWSPDSNRLVYVSQRNGHHQIFEYDFHTHQEKPMMGPPSPREGAVSVTGGGGGWGNVSGEAESPVYSPDGKAIAYVLSEKELHVISGGQDKLLAQGHLDEPRLTWSPDSQWLAFASEDSKSFRNLNVVPAAGGPAWPITFVANGNSAESLAWSPDGQFILFETAQRSENYNLARVDLIPHLPKYREDQFRQLFQPGKTPGGQVDEGAEPAATPTPPPATLTKKGPVVHIDPKEIRQRLSLLPLGLSATDPVISPDGKTLLFTARSAGQSNLYTWSLDELAKEAPVARQLTSTAGEKSDAAFTPDSKEVYYLEGGVPHSVALDTRTPKTVTATATLDVDFDKEKLVVFDQAWRVLDRRFYDEHFHGHDWRALREHWLPYMLGAHTPEELARDLSLLIGELNASHCGYSLGPSSTPAVPIGNLGLRFERETFEKGQGLVVREIISQGPCAGLVHSGDYLLAVNGRELNAHSNLDELLQGQVGHRVELRLGTRTVVVKPVSTSTAAGLLYRDWVESRRGYVDKLSGGKLGYVHIADMTENSLNQLYLDLDAANQAKRGVVVDIRNNNGGFVNGFALDVFARKNYLLMTSRGGYPVPSRQRLGQRALGLPTVLLTNESSLSDAEDFTEGYRALKLGKVVGVPTAGWIIFTSSYRLVDGSTVRMPFVRVQDLRGQNLELHPRPVDIPVERQLGEGSDSQLEKAVRTLLGELQ